MVPSGPPAGAGGAQQPSPSLLRSNSSLLPAGQPFASLASPRSQFGSNAMPGNISNISALLNNSFGNGGTGMPAPPQQDPLAFSSPSGAAQPHFGSDLPHPMQLDAVQNFSQQQQQQFLQHNSQQLRGGGGAVPMKMEQQIVPGEKNGPSAQQLQALRGGMGHAKMEPQQLQQMRGFGGVKMESHNSEQSMFMQRQQQQQMMQLSRQNSQEAATQQLNMLQQQQRVMQIHQQQMLNSSPQRRAQLQQQQQQFQQSSLSVRPQVKPSNYEPGTCARRLTYYMHHQQRRPQDNNIEFWKKFVAEYFAPNARKRWCVSLYGNGRQTTGVSQQDIWHCEMCNRKPGRGFETTVEVLPRLCQIKYDSGTLEELLYVDMPHEYHNSSGQIVLDYAKAVQESVFEQLRVVRDGQLRIVFNQDLKISSWEFCAKRHEELIPRRLLIPQVTQLGVVVQKYQATAQNVSSSLSPQDLQNTCNSFVTTARQLAKALEVPLVNDLGYTKRYVRCLQISEVVNSMKDLIDYSSQTGSGPIDSLINFPRRTTASSGIGPQHSQQHEGQQTVVQNANTNDQNSVHAVMQISATNTGVGSMNSPLNSVLTTKSTTTSVGLHQTAPMVVSSANSPYGGGNTAHVASTNSSNSIALVHPNLSPPFTSPTISASNVPTSNSHSSGHLNYTNSPANMPTMQQAATPSQEIDGNGSQSSVQQIIQDVMMCTQLNGSSSLGSEMKGIDGVTPLLSGSSSLVGNGMLTDSANLGISGMGFRSMGTLGQSAVVNGIRGATNNAMAGNGRVGKNSISQDHAAMSRQHDMGNRLLGKLGAVSNFNDLQFDWKSSP